MRPGMRNFLITFGASLLVFGVTAMFLVSFVNKSFINGIFGSGEDTTESEQVETDEDGNPINTTQPTTKEPDSTEPTTETSNIKGESFTALIVGLDYADKDAYKSVNADSITMVRFDKESKKLHITALPPNMKVFYGGYDIMLGSMYADYGYQKMTEKITSLTGIKIDYYFYANIAQAVNAINVFDPISFSVPTDMQYSFTGEAPWEINLKKGTQLIDGNKALQMLRFKGNGESQRMQVAVSYIQEVLRQCFTLKNVSKAPEFYNKIAKNINTNFTLADLTKNTDLIFSYSLLTVNSIDYPGTSKLINNIQWFEPNISQAVNKYKVMRAAN